MITRLRQQEGLALVTAIVVITTMMSIGLAVYSTVDTQVQQSKVQKNQESSFNLAEGALQQQGYVLGDGWPGSATGAFQDCVFPGSTPAGACPQPNNLANASGTGSFTQADFKTGVVWSTAVRDNPGGGTFYDETVDAAPCAAGTPAQVPTGTGCRWDSNGDRQVWVRASATVRGRKRAIVALLRRELLNEGLPRSAITAGSFRVTNNGNKTVIDATGSQVIVRCSTNQPPTPGNPCTGYNPNKGHVSPADSVVQVPSTPPAMSAAQVARFKSTAQSGGTYYTSCPGSLAGKVVFIDLPGATNCQYQGNTVYNAPPAAPGLVVMPRGTFTMRGSTTYYGIIYLRNEQNSCGVVGDVGGNGGIVGSITIDGCGSLDAGSNGNSGINTSNITFSPNAFNQLNTFGTAGLVQSTWRELPPYGQ